MATTTLAIVRYYVVVVLIFFISNLAWAWVPRLQLRGPHRTNPVISTWSSPSERIADLDGSNSASDSVPALNSASPLRSIAKSPVWSSFDVAVINRNACKRFLRFDGKEPNDPSPSKSDPAVIQAALECLDLARRTPTSYNSQPYKIVLVSSPEQKLALSKYCLGPNQQRILDSDCTAIFLADRKVLATLPRFRKLLTTYDRKKPLSKRELFQMQFYLATFSSGYPLPRFLSSIFSFIFRTAMSIFDRFSSVILNYPLPSLGSAETWSSKQASMVAMTYMLACSARGLATLPMEGIQARGIRRIIQAPSRYAIPLIVGTGRDFALKNMTLTETDKFAEQTESALNMEQHRKPVSPRYPMEELVYREKFESPTLATG